MSLRREGLRPALRKLAKPPPKSNAEKCKEYRERLKENDPVRHEDRLRKNREAVKLWQKNFDSEKKEHQKVLARLRQRRRREKLKQESVQHVKNTSNVSIEACQCQGTPTNAKTRQEENKAVEKREKARRRQAKRRALICQNPQKYRREKEKRRRLYHEKKQVTVIPDNVKKNQISLSIILNGIKRTLAQVRSKLTKLDLVLKIIARKQLTSPQGSWYKRPPQQQFCVEHFFEKVSIDIPGSKIGRLQKKVLTQGLSSFQKGASR